MASRGEPTGKGKGKATDGPSGGEPAGPVEALAPASPAGKGPEPPAPPRQPRAVRKREGRVVPFDRACIAAAVRRAQEAVGEDDPRFPQEVADVVTLTLAARPATPPRGGAVPPVPPVPTVEEIQDLVERALIEMGRARLAKAYILYRDRRARARDALTILERPDRRGQMPWVREGGGTAPWNAARIVAALMDEAELPRELAEEVAERVEGRVLDSGLRRLSTALIREFVDNELLAMGLESSLRRQEPVGLPRHDLRRLLARPRTAPRPEYGGHVGHGGHGGEGGDGWDRTTPGDLAEAVAGSLLTRYALADLLDERTADLHRAGALWVEGLERPHEVLARALPAELYLRREPSPRAGFELLGELAPLLRSASHGLVLEGLHGVVAPLLDGARGGGARGAGALGDLLASFGALARAAGRRLDLSAPGGRGGALAGRLVRELHALGVQGVPAPRLFLAWEELAPALEGAVGAVGGEGVADAAEALLARGALVPVWHAPEERWAGPGCRRRKGERGALCCAGAVALNLPRLARQAGPWREDLLFEALAARLQSAVDALQALDAFQRRHPAARMEAVRERRAFAVVPVGLAGALRILGDGELRPGQGARLLGVLAEAARRFAEERGLGVVLSPFFGAAAGAHFAAVDARIPRVSQPRLFDDLPAPERADDRPYGTGYALHPSLGTYPGAGQAAPGVALAEFLATVPSGALVPGGVPGGVPGSGAASGAASSAGAGRPGRDGESHPRLAAWRRFHEHRIESRRAGGTRPRPAREVSAGPLFRPGPV